MDNWEPKSYEDKLLYQYWTGKKGNLFLEVPIGSNKGLGNWPSGSKVRRIDGVIVIDDTIEEEFKVYRPREYTSKEFLEHLQGKTIE